MPSEMRWGDFKRKFGSYGVSITPGKGSHFKLEKTINGIREIYSVPVHANTVDYCYVKKARRRFQLLPGNGVSDEEFNRR